MLRTVVIGLNSLGFEEKEGFIMWINNCIEDNYDIGDGFYGIVVGGCKKGVILKLENGQEAFALFGGLPPGTGVLCTVLKKAKETWRVMVAIDSVIHEVVPI